MKHCHEIKCISCVFYMGIGRMQSLSNNVGHLYSYISCTSYHKHNNIHNKLFISNSHNSIYHCKYVWWIRIYCFLFNMIEWMISCINDAGFFKHSCYIQVTFTYYIIVKAMS